MLALSEASTVALLLGAMTLLGTISAAWFARGAQREAGQANRAVNKVGPQETPLRERVVAIEEVQREHTSLLRLILEQLTRP